MSSFHDVSEPSLQSKEVFRHKIALKFQLSCLLYKTAYILPSIQNGSRKLPQFYVYFAAATLL